MFDLSLMVRRSPSSSDLSAFKDAVVSDISEESASRPFLKIVTMLADFFSAFS